MKSKKVSAIGIDASKHGADMGAKTARFKKLPAFFAAGNIFSMGKLEVSPIISISTPILCTITSSFLNIFIYLFGCARS